MACTPSLSPQGLRIAIAHASIIFFCRGIDVVRQEIQDFASTKTIFSNKFKLIILDECDAMTRDAQMALRRGERGVSRVIYYATGNMHAHTFFSGAITQ